MANSTGYTVSNLRTEAHQMSILQYKLNFYLYSINYIAITDQLTANSYTPIFE